MMKLTPEQLKSLEQELTPLFDKAIAEGLWFYTDYQQLWFSPKALREHQMGGRFRWGAQNWKLRDPEEMIEEAYQQLDTAQQNLRRIKRLVQGKGEAAEP